MLSIASARLGHRLGYYTRLLVLALTIGLFTLGAGAPITCGGANTNTCGFAATTPSR